jgi:hypothetical protein
MARPKDTDRYYAIYRGDELLAHGPLWEMAYLFHVEEKTIRELSHQSHYDRIAKALNPEKRLLAVRVESLSKEDIVPLPRRKG